MITFRKPDGSRFDPDKDVPNVFCFCALMAVYTASKRGGRNWSHIRECASFVEDVIGRRLSVRDPLPLEYDWRPSAAVDLATEMMSYDG